MRRKVISEVLKFIAGTLNTISLAFKVVGFVNPFVKREELQAPWDSLSGESKKLSDLGLEPFNPRVKLNWLLTAAVIYAFELLALGVSRAIDNET